MRNQFYLRPHLYSDGPDDYIQVDNGDGSYSRFPIDHIGLLELAAASTRRLRNLHAKSAYGTIPEQERVRPDEGA
jgi:hypothetical protein